METVLLSPDDVEECLEIEAVVSAVEEAFEADALGNTQMPAKSYVTLQKYNGDFRSMPAYLDTGDWDAAGVKWVNVHPDNPDNHDIPTVLATLIYSDPANGFPLAVMDGTVITRERTGAASAVATDYLAIEDAQSLGIVGAGVQAYTQLEAIASVRPIEEVVVSDVNEELREQFISHFQDRFDVRGGSNEEAAACDVLSTVTPVRDPIISRDAVGEHTHINAVGADAEGKQELETQILLDSKLVIDDFDQCTHSGEINVPWSEGALDDDQLYGEIGDIVAGNIDGRTDQDGITVFDSTGLGIQDIATARVAYTRAKDQNIGTPFPLVLADG